MNTQNWIYHACGIVIVSAILLSTANASDLDGQLGEQSANCSTFLPADATRVDSFHLCQSRHTGKNAFYACQNFTAADGRYRVFFQGGRYPKAIAKLTQTGKVHAMLWSEEKLGNRPVCDIPSPIQIPAATKFMGAGICQDEANQSIACTVFRHKAARVNTISDYMVYYKTDGTGPDYTSSIYISVNQDAAPAELAYQIGLNLLKTRCCQQQGLKYIAHAYDLFPDSTLYRATYQHFRQLVLNGDLSDQLLVIDGEYQ